MYTCVLGVSIFPVSAIFLFYFGIVPTVWYFLFFLILELFPQCGILFCMILELFPQCGIFFFFMILELFQNVVFVFMILELFRQCGNFYYNTLLCARNYNLKFIKVDLETN